MSDLNADERERVRRALDLLAESRARLGFTEGVGELKRAENLLASLEGVAPIEADSDAVEELRETVRGRFR